MISLPTIVKHSFTGEVSLELDNGGHWLIIVEASWFMVVEKGVNNTQQESL